MANLAQALAAWLEADPAIAAIVVSDGEARIYPVAPPVGSEPPSVSYKVISSVATRHLGGASGVRTARYRITANSKRFGECDAIREAVRQLDGFMGVLSGVRILFVEADDVHDTYVTPPQGSDDGTYDKSIDLKIKYRESVPS